MELPQNDLDRLLFFEQARKAAETEYTRNPLDAENLTRWGGALLELSQFQSGSECTTMIKEAIGKLEEALIVNPKKHDALWCLGNAQTSQAFLSADHEAAKVLFKKATESFQLAVSEDPGNELYVKSLEMTSKAPELYMELQQQMAVQQAAASGPSTASSVAKQATKKKKNNDLKYDICGWIILAVGIVAWVGMAKSHLPSSPPV